MSRNSLVETIEISPTEFVEIHVDSDPMNPRTDWDCHLGEMICWHKRYCLGDKHDYDSPSDFEPDPEGVCLSLYLYDHSGITMSASPFSCHWDSGQIGYIYCSPEKILAEFGKNDTETKEKVRQCLLSEVEVYDDYLTGSVYGYLHFKKPESGDSYYDWVDDETWREDPIDSCFGFYGSDYKTNGIAGYIPALLETAK